MARYRVLAHTFINDSLREPGEIVEWNGVPNFNLEPLDPEELVDWEATTADPVAVETMKAERNNHLSNDGQLLPGQQRAATLEDRLGG